LEPTVDLHTPLWKLDGSHHLKGPALLLVSGAAAHITGR
jgi:hypothetical protein